MMRARFTPEQILARCRRAAAALVGGESPTPREVLAYELADLLRQLETIAAQSEPDTAAWLKAEAAAVRDSVVTARVRTEAPAWATPLLVQPGIMDTLNPGDGPEEYE